MNRTDRVLLAAPGSALRSISGWASRLRAMGWAHPRDRQVQRSTRDLGQSPIETRETPVEGDRYVRVCQRHGLALREAPDDGLVCPPGRHVVYEWDVVDRQKRRAVVAVNVQGDLAAPTTTVAPIPALRPRKPVLSRNRLAAVGLPAFLPLLPTVSEAAVYLGVGRGAVERLIHERALHVDRRDFVTWPRSERNVPRVPYRELVKYRRPAARA